MKAILAIVLKYLTRPFNTEKKTKYLRMLIATAALVLIVQQSFNNIHKTIMEEILVGEKIQKKLS